MAKSDLDEEKLMELTGKVFENVSAAGSLLNHSSLIYT